MKDIIIIGNKKENTSAVISLIGGTVKKFVWKGSDIIFPERKVGDKSRGGIPICFPFFGLPPEEFSEIPKHGWLRREKLHLDWAKSNKVLLVGENESTEAYPWILRYKIIASINSMGLKHELIVERLKDGMDSLAPVNPGFHPYFYNLDGGLAIIGNERIIEFKKDSSRIPISNQISIDSGKWMSYMELEGYHNGSSCLTLWSDNPRKYFCVEPVLTYPNLFAKPEGKFLRTGQVLRISCTIRPYAHYI